MSQKPARRMQIIRTPQPPPFGPSRRQPAPRTVSFSADGCLRCGALIADRDVHTRFHDGLDRTNRWADAVTKILRLLGRDHPELGSFPAQGDTASDGDNTTTDGE